MGAAKRVQRRFSSTGVKNSRIVAAQAGKFSIHPNIEVEGMVGRRIGERSSWARLQIMAAVDGTAHVRCVQTLASWLDRPRSGTTLDQRYCRCRRRSRHPNPSWDPLHPRLMADHLQGHPQ
jgi:hypothetical protein